MWAMLPIEFVMYAVDDVLVLVDVLWKSLEPQGLMDPRAGENSPAGCGTTRASSPVVQRFYCRAFYPP